MRPFNILLWGAVAAGFGAAFYVRSSEPSAASAPTATVAPQAAAAVAPAAEGSTRIAGEVLEVMDVSGYTYLRIGEKGQDGTWTAVSTASVKVGEKVSVSSSTKMQGFTSATLGRTFDVIYFGTLEGEPGAAPPTAATAATAAAMAPGVAPFHEGLGIPIAEPAAEKGPVQVGKVEKASGKNAERVADVFAKQKALSGKSVRLRGVVVKSTPNVMGKTYLHLQDGSGDQAKKTHDIVVTTQAQPKEGTTVTVEGKVVLDRDLGAGYRYDVLIEDATLDEG